MRGDPARPPGPIAVLAAAAVFGWITADVALGGPLTRLDVHVSDELFRWDLRRGTLWIKAPLYGLTQLGGRVTVLVCVLPILLLACWYRRTPRPLYRLAVLAVLLTASVYALKYEIERPAPIARFLGVSTGESYPSGHVPNAVLMWGLAAWVAADCGFPAAARRFLAGWRWVAPVLVSAGMLLLNYHWLTDLVGGFALGILLLRALHLIEAVALRHLPGGGERADGAGGAGDARAVGPAGAGRGG